MLKFSGLSCLLQVVIIFKDTIALRFLIRLANEIACEQGLLHWIECKTFLLDERIYLNIQSHLEDYNVDTEATMLKGFHL